MDSFISLEPFESMWKFAGIPNKDLCVRCLREA